MLYIIRHSKPIHFRFTFTLTDEYQCNSQSLC